MPLKLSEENYYSQEANQEYMSVSQYKDFMKCEAAALAKINGRWKDEPNENFLVGSYVHAWSEGKLDEFKGKMPEIFNSKGQLYAQYKHANTMIKTLENDGMCMFALQGEKEVILTSELFGALWKAKLDVYNPTGGRFVDLKTTKGIHEKVWSDEMGGYTSFVEAYGYTLQMAVYAELEKRVSKRDSWLEPFIVAISKEKIPDKAVIGFDNDIIQYYLDIVEEQIPHVMAVKKGEIEPKRCEHCEYCRHTKKLTGVIHYSQLLG